MRKTRTVLTVKYPVGYSCRAFGVVTGTPTEVVKVMYENRSPFMKAKSLKSYVLEMVRDSNALGIRGMPRSKNPEQYALTFLRIMDKAGAVKILPTRPA